MEKTEKDPQDLLKERMKRVEDAVQLKVPDRVPFVPSYSFFPMKYAGISFREAMYDYDKFEAAFKKFILDFEPDMYVNLHGLIPLGATLEILDYKPLKWPGHGIDSYRSYQYVEGEYMKAEEYDEFLSDPSGFMLKTFFPRVYGALEPLSMLPPLPWLHDYYKTVPSLAVLGTSEMAGALESLLKAGAEAYRMRTKAGEFTRQLKALGFPCEWGAAAAAPFDYFGDCLRGMRGVMLDMHRNQEKLLEAMDKILPLLLETAKFTAAKSGTPIVYHFLHRCADNFMSPEQFKTFYWPTLRKLMLGLIEHGLTPCAYFEGNCGSRLDIIGDIPKAKAIYRFAETDIFRAKQVLGGQVCLRGNVPASMLCLGTPEQIRAYCKKLIDLVGRDGGFIMDGGTGIPDEAKVENVKAMAEVTKEYGVYR